jgi:hypothetical protein
MCNMTDVGLRCDSDLIGSQPAGRRVERPISFHIRILTRIEILRF